MVHVSDTPDVERAISGTNSQLAVSDLGAENVEELWQDKQSVRVRASCQQQQMRCHVKCLSHGCSCVIGSVTFWNWWLRLNDTYAADAKLLVLNARVELTAFNKLILKFRLPRRVGGTETFPEALSGRREHLAAFHTGICWLGVEPPFWISEVCRSSLNQSVLPSNYVWTFQPCTACSGAA